MIALDTNVLVRFLVQDDAMQGQAASALIDGLTELDPGYICREVIVELVWVLERVYKVHRGREQACACPPAQIPACALTHGAPTSDDDERPLVKPRALKPVAVTRETPTQGRHRKCVLHYLNRQCRVVVSTDRLGVDP